MADALSELIAAPVEERIGGGLNPLELVLSPSRSMLSALPQLQGDSFEILRQGRTIQLRAGSERGLLHGVYDMLAELGASFAPWRPPQLSPVGPGRLDQLKPRRVIPAFHRRAFASDIMTWHYEIPERFEMHLEHDRLFAPWMVTQGINGFFFIRHSRDQRSTIDELVPLFAARGVDCEYGGHVLPLLLPRRVFETHPEYFPEDAGGGRIERGNLCVSSAAALGLVRENAVRYIQQFPENALLHLWGADLRDGGWCRCADCCGMPPQLQYMTVVNTVADAIAGEDRGRAVAYLAYHDTLQAVRGLRPRPNVWVEWAPRERCYSHPIDDSGCVRNQRYFESLKRHIELFDGRAIVFEYYADAILFGGLGLATPSVIARDLRAYRSLGVQGISCLTFGAYSLLAYPVNLQAFVRATRSPDFDPEMVAADVAAERHPECAGAMASAYRALELGAAALLNYGDVMRPRSSVARRNPTAASLRRARRQIGLAISAAQETISAASTSTWARDELSLWRYGLAAVEGIGDFVEALAYTGEERRRRGKSAAAKIAAAPCHLTEISPHAKGTWGCYDFERWLPMCLDWMRRKLDECDDVTRAHSEPHQQEGD